MPANSSAIATIVKAGLAAGALDISAAIVDYYISTGKHPVPMFRFIASGVFGKAALAGGSNMTAWGLVFHFLIAIIFAAIFFAAWPYLSQVVRSPIVAGLLYGLAVWATMNQLVLPLSQAPALPFSWPKTIKALIIVTVCVGLPIALIVSRKNSKASSRVT